MSTVVLHDQATLCIESASPEVGLSVLSMRCTWMRLVLCGWVYVYVCVCVCVCVCVSVGGWVDGYVGVIIQYLVM